MKLFTKILLFNASLVGILLNHKAYANIQDQFTTNSADDNFKAVKCTDFSTSGSDSLSNVYDTSTTTGANYKSCYSQPSVYKFKLYRISLCTSSPLVGSKVDFSSCVDTFNNSAGVEIDLGNLNSTIALDNSKSRPPSGTYTDMLMVMGNSFTLKGSYTTAVTTYNTENDSSSHGGKFTPQSSNANPQEFEHSFAKYGFAGTGCTYTYQRTPSDGQIRAALTNNDSNNDNLTYQTSVSGGQCGGTITRLVGNYIPNAPLKITDETNGLELQFVISDGGMQVESALNNHSTGSSTHNKQPSWAFAGDFKPKFIAF